ncbi:hypothetical protein GH714_033137 [Hevea brasiliensis]|uniref:UME domain-containing protein n=1 Tax=Hevea brasiliensis TaxID=3981 RepID=A0A6A6LL55_HEVBR|nr:hypothetical protein GH714_033137 [Hevea brasiliensis]
MGGQMASNLSSLVHELRERIAATSSTPPSKVDDDALEIRFRAVLPNLLHAYVVPSSSASEREVIAVLKLISHTARNFPGVFYHGKASAVLPVIGRILPFFAEPAFRSRHGVIFETVGSLLSLLRTGARDAYCQFFIDAMSVVEDLLYVASLSAEKTSISSSAGLTLKCFCKSFTGFSGDPTCLCDLPASSKPMDGAGILINIMDKRRWQPFATWIIRLLNKCVTEGTLYVEGLINISSVLASCSLLCYGDADLHMACFDFARIIGSVIDSDIIPHQNIIESIATILSKRTKKGFLYSVELFVFDELLIPLPFTEIDMDLKVGLAWHHICGANSRNMMYDSSIGGCLTALHSSCPDDVVKLTAAHLMNVLPLSMYRTKSQELKEALCIAYKRIARTCPPHIWKPECLIRMLCFQEPYSSLIDCLHVTLLILGPERVGGRVITNGNVCLPASSEVSIEKLRVGEKRHVQDIDNIKFKRQKVDGDIMAFAANVSAESKPTHIVSFEKEDEEYADYMHTSLLSFLELLKPPSVRLESLRPHVALTALSMLCIAFCRYQMTSISLSIIQQMCSWIPWICEQANLGGSITLNISIYLEGIRSILLMQRNLLLEDKLLKLKGDDVNLMHMLLKLPWTHSHMVAGPHPPWKAKCTSVKVVPMLGNSLKTESVLEVLDLGLHDDAEDVRLEAVISMPMIVLWSGLGVLAQMFERLDSIDGLDRGECKLFLDFNNEKHSQTDYLLQGFWCLRCDRSIVPNHEVYSKIMQLPVTQSREVGLNCDFFHLQSFFFKLLYDDSLEEVQVGCARIIQRVLVHGTTDILIKTRFEWIRCVEFLLVNAKKAVREAFCTQIIDISSQLFLYSLILLVDQLDNPYVTVRMSASRLIHKSCFFHLKGGFELILSKVVHIRNELFDYLTMSLASRPQMVREFAEAVFGIETKELVEKMIPTVLPKLVVSRQDNEKAVNALLELAKCVNTDMVPLIVNWLPKVLAFALHRSDRQELFSTLQFYHDQTGSDNQEIFAAALPALLDELVCFLDGADSMEINQRLSQVPEMIKEIARVLTGAEDLPCFLRNHFVGLLNSIDRKMLHSEDFSLQKQALQRIKMLIEMMGVQLNTYVPKLMVILMHAIDKESLQSEGLSVLHFFIMQLANKSPSSTKHVISQVFAALIPILERYKENSSMHLNKVVKILEELVLNNRIILKQHIHEFPPLPSIPALVEVNKVIQEARGSMTLRDQLRDVIDGLNHENLNVRYMVACELSKLLNLRREDITALITGEVAADMDVLSFLITSLLRGCAEESRTVVGQRLKLVCADSLGALGAVDPAKVKGFSCQRFKIECSDDDLIFELIHKHLARAFRASPDTVVQDSAALAIQELLKIAGCEASLDENVTASSQSLKEKSTENSSGMNNRGQRLWDRFSNYVKEIIAPCLTSRFQLPNVADSASAGPIYRPSMSFRRWIFFG